MDHNLHLTQDRTGDLEERDAPTSTPDMPALSTGEDSATDQDGEQVDGILPLEVVSDSEVADFLSSNQEEEGVSELNEERKRERMRREWHSMHFRQLVKQAHNRKRDTMVDSPEGNKDYQRSLETIFIADPNGTDTNEEQQRGHYYLFYNTKATGSTRSAAERGRSTRTTNPEHSALPVAQEVSVRGTFCEYLCYLPVLVRLTM